MNFSLLKKQLLPHLLAIGILLTVGSIYFSPVLSGEVIETHDILQHNGMAKEVKEFKEETGETSLWTNSMFGGMPTYQIAPNYPNSLFLTKPIFKILARGLPKPLNMLILYFIGFYLLLISFKVDWRLALAGALAYGFASYNIIIIDAGHNTKALAIGLAPLVLAGVNMTLNSKRWILGAALAGITLAFQLHVNHVQITYYLFFIIAGMGIAWLVKEIQSGNTKTALVRTAVLGVAILLGVGSNAGNIMTTAEYAKESTRGKSNIPNKNGKLDEGLSKDYITQWSYDIPESATIFIPNFRGGGAQNNVDFSDYEYFNALSQQYGKRSAQQIMQGQMYWGGQTRGTNGPAYLGAVICFLFVLGLFLLDKPTVIWVSAVSLLSIMLAWGSYFPALTNFFIDYFPAYNKFRTVTMILVIVQITFPLTGILVVSKIAKKEFSRDKVINALKWSVGIVGGFALLFALMPGMFFDFVTDRELNQYADGNGAAILDMIVEARESLMKKDAFRSLLFVLVAATGVFLFITNKLKANVLYIILVVGIAADMWPVAGRFLGPDKFDKPKKEGVITANKIDREIMKDPDLHYRVLNLTLSAFSDATTSYFHKSIGGYHGAKLKRIKELIEHRVEGEIQAITSQNFRNPKKSPVLNMFNVKYFIASTNKGKQLVPNRGALGNAWLVNEVEVLDGAPEEMEALADLDPSTKATTTKEFADYVAGFTGNTNGTVELVEYQPNYLKYKYDTKAESFVVFSEVFYKGNRDWISTIDGNEAEHIRVNYHLRGMKVPAGSGEIEFKFDPPTYHTAETLSLVSSILIILMLLGGGFLAFRKEPETGEVTKNA